MFRSVEKYVGKGDLLMTAAVDGRRMPTKLSETSAVTMILSKIEYAGMISFHRTPG